MKKALYATQEKEDKVRCGLCPNRCLIAPGARGRCRVRENQDGVLYSLNYGKISALNIDPVEKKPLRRFMPGTKSLSMGSIGCNFHCPWCQNYSISMGDSPTEDWTPEDVVKMALEVGTPSISYTYNEPTIYIEFVLETARLAKEKGLKNIYVTNGYICSEPLGDLLEYIDAFNIDVKTFDPEIYKKFCGGQLSWIQQTVEKAAKKAHVEITALLVTGVHDNREGLEKMFAWIASVDPAMPLHLTRYFPAYKYHEDATKTEFMMEMKALAEKYLQYVYLGNI